MTNKQYNSEEALQMLKEGNGRYRANKMSGKADYAESRKALAGGQKPFAVVLCCSDSRVVPEIFFDQSLGDIFVVRNAGNVVDEVVLGSIEYAAEHFGSSLVAVVGHSRCGAVTAAFEGGELPRNIQSIADRIAPSAARGSSVDEAVRINAKEMAGQVRSDEIIRHLGVRVEAAYYDIVTGEVSWLQ